MGRPRKNQPAKEVVAAQTPEEHRETFSALLAGRYPPASKVALLVMLVNGGREMTLEQIADAGNLTIGEAQAGLHPLIRSKMLTGDAARRVQLTEANLDLVEMMGHLVSDEEIETGEA